MTANLRDFYSWIPSFGSEKSSLAEVAWFHASLANAPAGGSLSVLTLGQLRHQTGGGQDLSWTAFLNAIVARNPHAPGPYTDASVVAADVPYFTRLARILFDTKPQVVRDYIAMQFAWFVHERRPAGDKDCLDDYCDSHKVWWCMYKLKFGTVSP